jgi:hypothetical protein
MHYFEITMPKHPNCLMAQSKTHPAYSRWVGLCYSKMPASIRSSTHPHCAAATAAECGDSVWHHHHKEYFVLLPAKLA